VCSSPRAIDRDDLFPPGVDSGLIEAINRRDLSGAARGLLMLGLIVMLVNLFVDIAYGFINPRIRHSR
jgi:dipeptide transport system permease protein